MIKYDYSIDEILSAVDKIQNKKKDNRIDTFKITKIQKDFSEVPVNTLKLIEEAEKIND